MSEYYDLATAEELDKNLTWYTQRFVLFPERLMGLSLPVSLNWKRLKFTLANRTRVTQKRGVYAFVVQHNDTNLPSHGYITYIGITGHQSTKRDLQKRYQDYLQEQKRPKRRSIHRMLNKWRDCLYFHFAEVNDNDIDLEEIEKKLNSAIIPPYSTNDFDVDVRRAKGIWEKS